VGLGFMTLLALLLLSLLLAPAAWAQRSLPEDGQRDGHDLHVGVHAGWWNFDSAFRYEDEALIGLRAGAWVTRGLSLEVDLEHMRTRNERVGESVRAYFLNIHGRLHYRPEALLSPGVLAGVSFMAADNEKTQNSITEGFDIGPVLAVRLGERTTLLAEALFRYTSVRVNFETQNGEPLDNDAVEYVWSGGVRVGVDFAF